MNLSKEFKLFVGPKADHSTLGGCGGTHLYGIRLSERKRAFAKKHGLDAIIIHESFFPYRCIEDFMRKGRDGN
jgi:hypothetical protein